MRRRLCQMWNCSPAELDQLPARRTLHETALIDLFEAEMRARAQGASSGE
ncbi:MAG: hypothetical protein IT360_13050 [Gemmatimonadaceae bacterium]|nr:hypothetical protein [Gemmatimonadaceae bacterium]